MAVKVGTAFVDVEGDFSALDRQIKSATSDASSKFKNFGKVAAAGVAVGAAGFVALGKASADAAIEAEKSQARLEAQLKASNISYKDHAKAIDEAIKKTSQLSGIDDEDLADSFTNIVRVTGDVNEALKLNALAADISRARNIDVARAGDLVAKMAGGNVNALSRYGVKMQEGATVQEALAAAQGKFAGQAEAYGNTTAGAQDKFRVAIENLQEKIGAVLLPTIAKFAEALTGIIAAAENGTGVFGSLSDIWSRYKDVIVPVGAALGAAAIAIGAYAAAAKIAAVGQAILNAAMLANPVGAVVVALAALTAGVIVAYKESKDFREIVNKVGDTLADVGRTIKDVAVEAWEKFGSVVSAQARNVKDTVEGLVRAIKLVLGGLIDFVAGVFTGDWSRAWEGVKAIFAGIWAGITTVLNSAWSTLVNAVKLGMTALITAVQGMAAAVIDLGKWIVNRLVDGVKAMGHAILDAAGWLKNRIKEHVEAQAAAVVDIGKWIVNRLAEGIKTITEALASVGGWVKNRVEQFVHAAAEGFISVGSWIINRVADGITTVTDALGAVGGWIKNRVKAAVEAAKDGFESIGGWIMDKIVAGLKGGANLFVGFINKIIGVINKIPGVDIGKVSGFAEGGVVGAEAMARGGKVSKPIVMMGEEAPRHPEYVIPTNPAYRKRAKMLLGEAAGAIGFAQGGVYSQKEIEALASRYGLPNPGLMSAIAMAESGGRAGVTGPPDGRGLFQIEWPIWGNTMRAAGLTNPFDPAQNVQMAKIVLAQQGLGAWVVYNTGAYKQFTGGGGGGVLDSIGNAISGAAGAVSGILGDLISGGPDFLLKQLPGLDGLGWLKGTGDWVLDKVKTFIKDKVATLVGAAQGAGASAGNVDGLVDQVKQAITYARFNGWNGNVVSGFRTYAEQAALYAKYLNGTGNLAAKPGTSNHEGGQAIDVSDPEGFAAAMAKMGSNRLYRRVPGEPWHFSVTGYQDGGVFGKGVIAAPFVGSYATGGVVPRDGLAMVHAGETITPGGGMLQANIYVGDQFIEQKMVQVVRREGRATRGAYLAGAHR